MGNPNNRHAAKAPRVVQAIALRQQEDAKAAKF